MSALECLIASLIVVSISGAGAIFTVSTGIIEHRNAGASAAIGCTAAFVALDVNLAASEK